MATYKFLILPGEVVSSDLIPVEIIVIKDETLTPQSKFLIKEQTLTRKTAVAKSRMSTSPKVDRNIVDLNGPSPKDDNSEPNLSVDGVPVPYVVHSRREGEKAGSKPMVSIFRQPSSRLSPVNPSIPDEILPLEAELPGILTMAELGETQMFSKTRPTRETAVAKSRMSTSPKVDRNIVDLDGPSPKDDNSEPNLSVDGVPVLYVVHSRREGEKAESKPMVSIFRQPSSRLSPVNPSIPDEFIPLEAELPRILTMAELGETQTFPKTLKKIVLPLKRRWVADNFLSELLPIPIIESPVISEENETGRLVIYSDHPPKKVEKSEIKSTLQTTVLSDIRLALKKESAGVIKPKPPFSEPAALNLDALSTFPFPGSTNGAAYLFVVDTSGSVKGTPLEGIKKSALELVGLMGRNDRAGIMTFNDASRLIGPFTSEKKRLKQKISELRTAGKQTVLFDALMNANGFIAKEDRENRFIVLFSDGKDEGSQSSLDKIINETRRSGISILSVGYSRVEREYLAIMKNLAEKTGGYFVYAPQFHDILTLYRVSRDTRAGESEIETAKLAKTASGTLASSPLPVPKDQPGSSDPLIPPSIKTPIKEMGPVYTSDQKGLEKGNVSFEFIANTLQSLGKATDAFFVRFWLDKTQYRVGDTISYHFQSEKNHYLVVLVISTDGDITQLFPNKFNPHQFVQANKTYTIPAENLEIELSATGPPGVEEIIILAAEAPFDLLLPSYDKSPFFRIDKTSQPLLNQIGQNLKTAGKLNLAQKRMRYFIVETGTHAALIIKSNPGGAHLIIDRVSRGKTPMVLELPLGTYEVLLTLPDYYDWQAQVELNKEGETPLLVRLLPVVEEIKAKKLNSKD